MKPNILRVKVFSMQTCVPKTWTDEQAEEFAEKENPSGTSAGWYVVKQDAHDGQGEGQNERQQCDDCADHIHILMHC